MAVSNCIFTASNFPPGESITIIEQGIFAFAISSATLYPPEIRSWRKSLFDQWLEETKDINRESIIAFHQMANSDPDNDFIMNRNELVKTLSITSIQLNLTSGSILHLELDQDIREEIMIQYDR